MGSQRRGGWDEKAVKVMEEEWTERMSRGGGGVYGT